MNYSKQRELILDYINNCKSHPTADKIYNEVKKEMPSISFSTVYRNLNQLVNQNKIKKISLDSKKYIYDNVKTNHAHFYCIKCGMLEDIDIKNKVKFNINYEIQSIELVVKGICNDCKEK